MAYHTVEITDPERRSRICDDILRALPDWFGIEASLVEYVERVHAMPFYAAMDGDRAVGFAAIQVHNPYTAEVHVMGVLGDHHRHGVGRMLIARCDAYCREHGHEFLTVKTLDASHADDGYEKTRRFYAAMGFRPLEVFPLLWNEDNPCLFMAKAIGGADGSGTCNREA